jgi:hypothetical protein
MAEHPAPPRSALAAPHLVNANRLAVGQMVVVGAAAALFLRGTTSGPWVLLALLVGLHVVLLIGAVALLAMTYLLGTFYPPRVAADRKSRRPVRLDPADLGRRRRTRRLRPWGPRSTRLRARPASRGRPLAAGRGSSVRGGPLQPGTTCTSRLGCTDLALRRGHRRTASPQLITSPIAKSLRPE